MAGLSYSEMGEMQPGMIIDLYIYCMRTRNHMES